MAALGGLVRSAAAGAAEGGGDERLMAAAVTAAIREGANALFDVPPQVQFMGGMTNFALDEQEVLDYQSGYFGQDTVEPEETPEEVDGAVTVGARIQALEERLRHGGEKAALEKAALANVAVEKDTAAEAAVEKAALEQKAVANAALEKEALVKAAVAPAEQIPSATERQSGGYDPLGSPSAMPKEAARFAVRSEDDQGPHLKDQHFELEDQAKKNSTDLVKEIREAKAGVDYKDVTSEIRGIGSGPDVSEIILEVRASESEVAPSEVTTMFKEIKAGPDSTDLVKEVREEKDGADVNDVLSELGVGNSAEMNMTIGAALGSKPSPVPYSPDDAQPLDGGAWDKTAADAIQEISAQLHAQGGTGQGEGDGSLVAEEKANCVEKDTHASRLR